ncbi:unnamed protein product [Trichogramma brassicae]|uniref:Uncharacterized protein n=1 Tax=Trichogramma brassicae TaxID=86971 RepID=A0A6H5II48_9HYME|nr:unnamed protein product [Trichogramma brassicae]
MSFDNILCENEEDEKENEYDDEKKEELRLKHEEDDKNCIRVCAHRGAGFDYPENSLSAFRNCNNRLCYVSECLQDSMRVKKITLLFYNPIQANFDCSVLRFLFSSCFQSGLECSEVGTASVYDIYFCAATCTTIEVVPKSTSFETSDLSEKKDNLSLVDEDDIHLVVTDDEEIEQETNNSIDEDIELTDESSKASSVEPFKEDKGNESDEKQKSEKHKRKKRKKATAVLIEEAGIGPEFDNGVRHKRRSAKYAEEMIRKEIQNQDDDSSQDDNDTKEPQSNALIPASAPTLPAPNKRNQTDIMDENLEQPKKRIKTSTEKTDEKTLVAKQSMDQKLAINDKVIENVDKHNSTTNLKVRELVKQISQEDVRKKFKLMTREEMEALCIQKVTECLTNRGEIGKLRDEVRQAQLANESLKGKAATLLKMCNNFESVLTRINQDRVTQAGKFQPPIKINRSVGLQVNLTLKTSANASLNSSLNSSFNTNLNTSQTPNKVVINQRNFNTSTGLATLSPRKTIKTRSPRTVEITSTTTTSTIINPVTTTTPVVTIAAKPTSTESGKRNFTLQQVLLNTGPIVRQNPMTLQKNNSKKSDLIDLTDEEDKNNNSSSIKPVLLTM